MTWVTILFVSETENPELFKKVLDTCNYCVQKDKFRNFRYEVADKAEGIRIFSANKNQSFKRGMLFYKRFGVHFNVQWETNKRKT